MGVPISEVGYNPVMTRREDHEVHKGMWWHWTKINLLSISLIKFSTVKKWCVSVTLPYPSNQPTTHPKQSAKEFINVTQDGDGSVLGGLHNRHALSHYAMCRECSLVTSKV